MTKFVLMMLIPLVIAGLWDAVPIIKTAVTAVLNPTFGVVLNWNLWIGFLLIVAIVTFISSWMQKKFTNQEEMRKLKQEQKLLQEEMKKYKDHPEKLMELQKKQFEFIPKTMDLTLKPVMYTMIPFVLLFRWYYGILYPIWGGWWILYYLIASLIFSAIFKKVLKLA